MCHITYQKKKQPGTWYDYAGLIECSMSNLTFIALGYLEQTHLHSRLKMNWRLAIWQSFYVYRAECGALLQITPIFTEATKSVASC